MCTICLFISLTVVCLLNEYNDSPSILPRAGLIPKQLSEQGFDFLKDGEDNFQNKEDSNHQFAESFNPISMKIESGNSIECPNFGQKDTPKLSLKGNDDKNDLKRANKLLLHNDEDVVMQEIEKSEDIENISENYDYHRGTLISKSNNKNFFEEKPIGTSTPVTK